MWVSLGASELTFDSLAVAFLNRLHLVIGELNYTIHL